MGALLGGGRGGSSAPAAPAAVRPATTAPEAPTDLGTPAAERKRRARKVRTPQLTTGSTPAGNKSLLGE